MILIDPGIVLPQAIAKPNKKPKDIKQHYMPMIHKL